MDNLQITIDEWAEREVSSVKIEAPDNPDNDSTLTVKITGEGIVIDLWAKSKDPDKEYCKNTKVYFWEDLIEEMEIEHAMGK